MLSKRYTFVLPLLLLSACAPKQPTGGTTRALDQKNGFRDARFFSPLSEFEDLEFVEVREGLGCFHRKDERLELGGAKLDRIHYCFYKGRLASVILWGVGAKTAGELVIEMRRAYGVGEPLTGQREGRKVQLGFIWRGDLVTAVLLYVEQQSFPKIDLGQVVVTVSSNALLSERDADLDVNRSTGSR